MSFRNNKNYEIAVLGILTAIMIIMWETPLGTIPLGAVSVTIAHIPILVGTILLGFKEGLVLGFIFGLISMIKSYISPMTPLDPFFQNPLISIVPRLMIPIMTHLTVQATKKINKTLSMIFASIVGNLSNTFFVFLSLYLLVGDKIEAIFNKSALTVIFEIISAVAFLETLFVVLITVPIVTRINLNKKNKD